MGRNLNFTFKGSNFNTFQSLKIIKEKNVYKSLVTYKIKRKNASSNLPTECSTLLLETQKKKLKENTGLKIYEC